MANTKATQLCYWIIGNETSRPALAIDLHADNGELVGETLTFSLPNNDAAHAKAEEFAASIGVAEISYDPDSTEVYAHD